MGLTETEALILKSYNLGDADKIVIMLTQREGLVRGVAKGAKRLKSRFGGSLEPFSVIDLIYFQKEERELVSIRQIELVKSYFAEASNPNFLQKFAYLAELLTEFAPPSDPNERLYRMAKVCLETAAENPDNLESIVLYFELWILKLAGYLPDWQHCDDCKKAISSQADAGLQINFHLLCQSCQKIRNSYLISPEQRMIFTTAQKKSPSRFVEFTNDQQMDVRNVSSILKRIITHILGKESLSEKVLIANS
jgi:DNA repair protein RecO (recombination protein O)